MMMAAELNKSHVGESEALIRDIFNRASLLPHLACIAPLDEIDSAVPKRDDNGGGNQHGADKVASILGLIGGGTNVSNLYLVGATNRREAIDRPIQDRMPCHIYVGYPDHASRREMIEHYLLTSREVLGRQSGPAAIGVFFSELFVSKVADLTMNFSGRAVVELCQCLLGQWEEYSKGASADSYTNTAFNVEGDVSNDGELDAREDGQTKALFYLSRTISRNYNLMVGGRTMTELLAVDKAMATNEHRDFFWKHDHIKKATGLMVIVPDDKFTFQMETYVDMDHARILDAIDIPLRPYCRRCDRYAARVCVVDGQSLRMHERQDQALQRGEWCVSEDQEHFHPEEDQFLQDARAELLKEDRRTVWAHK
eukprot:6459405-Amphidinium_carterae.1